MHALCCEIQGGDPGPDAGGQVKRTFRRKRSMKISSDGKRVSFDGMNGSACKQEEAFVPSFVFGDKTVDGLRGKLVYYS